MLAMFKLGIRLMRANLMPSLIKKISQNGNINCMSVCECQTSYASPSFLILDASCLHSFRHTPAPMK